MGCRNRTTRARGGRSSRSSWRSASWPRHGIAGSASPLFRKTSCAVAYAHGVADYNGHFGIRELCDICPTSQLRRCAEAWQRPEPPQVEQLTAQVGGRLVEVNDRAVVVEGLDEPPRYFMQHNLGYQVHDAAKPHHHNQHDRADIGWPAHRETT